MILNPFRYVRYAIGLLMERRPKHAAPVWPRVRGVLASAACGAAILTTPIWMILLGVI